ncbi:MAG: Xaa-Pro peptidase family protein [Candidatus Aenigmatarchaeota archaeon]
MNEFRERLKKLDALKGKCDAILLMNFDEPFKDVNYFYFTGNDSTYSVFLYDFSEARIITNELELPKVKKESRIKNIGVFEKGKKISEAIRKNLGGAKTVGVNGNFPYFLAKKLGKKIVDISEDLENIRAIKSNDEIENIRAACNASDGIMCGLREIIKSRVSEKEIIRFVKTETTNNDCGQGFEPIANSGRKTAIPHETLPDRTVGKNDAVMIDIGCIKNKYNSDCTRMFFTGSLNKKIKQQYEMLKNIVAVSEDIIEAGMKAAELDDTIRKKLGPLSRNFIHATGHGVGLALHEKPFIGGKSKDILKEGMVFTIEPGIYFRNYGLRIEDTVLLTRNSIKVLTKTEKY